MGLAAEIKQRFGVEPVLIPGKGGIYDVVVDGKMIFSKHAEGRFPEDHEVFDALEP